MSGFWSKWFCLGSNTDNVPARKYGKRTSGSVHRETQELRSNFVETSAGINVTEDQYRPSNREYASPAVTPETQPTRIPLKIIPARQPSPAKRLNEHEVLLSDNPQISFMSNRKFLLSPNVFVFFGTFGERPVLVKQTSCLQSKCYENELKVLLRVEGHENIIRTWCRLKVGEFDYHVMEFYQISLQTLVTKGQETLLKNKEVLRQLTNAVAHLHHLNILYVNFEPGNIAITTCNGETRVKLSVFEHSKALAKGKKFETFKTWGNFWCVAPETFSRNEVYLGSDIYCLGELFFFVITKGSRISIELVVSSFETYDISIAEQHLRVNLLSTTSDTILSTRMIQLMMRHDSNARITIDQVREEPYFWNEHEVFDLVMKVAKKLEHNDHKKKLALKLQMNKRSVIGKSWITRIDDEVYKDLCQGREYDGANVGHLVRAIRNQFCHNSNVTHITGSTKEELKNFWCDRFPRLISHLYSNM
jgi:serine/threonine protein kinase